MADRYVTPIVDGDTYLVRSVPMTREPKTPKETTEYWIEAWSGRMFWTLLAVSHDEPSHEDLAAELRRGLAEPHTLSLPVPITPDQIAEELEINGGSLDPEAFFI